MTVPFFHIGPGQVARLGLQVLGKNGPVLNSTNVRCMQASHAACIGVVPSFPQAEGVLGRSLRASRTTTGFAGR